jgi:ATP-dependent protease ClpP protease subunit
MHMVNACMPRRPHPCRASQDIKLFINSPGGSVTAGMGIYDAMQMCRADIQTYCFGLAASMGAFLLGAGAKGKRYSMPNARIMIHQPLGGASGAAVDIEIQAKEIMYHKANLNRIMADYTGQPVERVSPGMGVGGPGLGEGGQCLHGVDTGLRCNQLMVAGAGSQYATLALWPCSGAGLSLPPAPAPQIEEDTDRDRYMSPLEAKAYGLIDQVVGGDEAVFRVEGSTRAFPKTKEQYVSWGDEDLLDGSRGSRWAGLGNACVRATRLEPPAGRWCGISGLYRGVLGFAGLRLAEFCQSGLVP